jgi:hypothetical protein
MNTAAVTQIASRINASIYANLPSAMSAKAAPDRQGRVSSHRHPLRGTAFGRKYRMVLAAALAMLALNEQPDSRELETAVSGRCAVPEDLPEQLGLSIATLAYGRGYARNAQALTSASSAFKLRQRSVSGHSTDTVTHLESPPPA